MEIYEIKQALRDYMRNTFPSLKYEFDESEEGKIVLKLDIVLTHLDNAQVLMKFHFNSNDSYSSYFIFNKVKDYTDVYYLINNFNCQNTWYKGYVNNNEYFVLEDVQYDFTNLKMLMDYVDKSFSYFVKDSTLNMLRPIANKLYPNND